LANGFASCDDPAALQAICDRLGPGDIWAFFERWLARIPAPLGERDRAGGYWWELSMRQVEVSRTLVFDAPRRGRAFFEAVVADNIGVGRPSEVRLIFGRQIRSTTKGTFRSRIVTRGVDVCLDVTDRDSRIKEYLTEGRALRIETVVNSPDDLGCQRRLTNLDELQAKARAASARLLAVQRVGQDCAISTRCASGSRSPRSRRANDPRHCGSGTPASWPWPPASACSCTPSSASPTGASAPR
jgi:hypothetical protein